MMAQRDVNVYPSDEEYVLPDYSLEVNDMFGGADLDATLQDLAALDSTSAPQKRNLVRPLMLLVSVILFSAVVFYAGLGGYDFLREWFQAPDMPPVSVAPAATAVPIVPVVLVETVVVTKMVEIEAEPVIVEVEVTPQPVAVAAAAPVLVAPAHGQTFSNPIVFTWTGILAYGDAYKVTLCPLDGGPCIDSPLLTENTWAVNIPAAEYGGWAWDLVVIELWMTGAGGPTNPSMWLNMFWFDPFPGSTQ